VPASAGGDPIKEVAVIEAPAFRKARRVFGVGVDRALTPAKRARRRTEEKFIVLQLPEEKVTKLAGEV
jgi:hypothetical protein